MDLIPRVVEAWSPSPTRAPRDAFRLRGGVNSLPTSPQGAWRDIKFPKRGETSPPSTPSDWDEDVNGVWALWWYSKLEDLGALTEAEYLQRQLKEAQDREERDRLWRARWAPPPQDLPVCEPQTLDE